MKHDTSFLRESQLAYNELRKQDQLKKESVKNALYEQKQNDVLQIRRQRALNEASKKEFENKLLQDKRSKSQSVKEQEAMSKKRLMQYYENKIKQYKQNHENDVALQEALKRKREAEVYTLEKMELEMLAKLQHTQDLEKVAYAQLEEAINVPTTELKNKYNSDFNTTKERNMFRLTKRTSSPVPSPFDSRSFSVMKKRNLDDSITKNERQNQSELFGKSNLKNVDQWVTRNEKVKREQRIYGKKSSGPVKILEKIITPRKNSLNNTIAYEKGESRGVGTYRRNSRNIEQSNPMNRNKSLGGEFEKSGDKNNYQTIGDYLGVANDKKEENEELLKLLEQNKEQIQISSENQKTQ